MKILTSIIYKMYSHYQESLNILLAEKCNNSKEIILKSSGILMLEKTLESPLDSKEMKPVHPNSECSLEELMLKMKLQYFGHEMIRTDSLEKTLMLGKIEEETKGRQKIGDNPEDEMVRLHG